jgi:hypothetical protein
MVLDGFGVPILGNVGQKPPRTCFRKKSHFVFALHGHVPK